MPTTTERIDVIGVPFNSAGTNDGVARAPTALRHAGLVGALTRVGLVVRDSGDLALPQPTSERDPDSHVIAPAALLAMIDHVRVAVAESLERGALPLVLGGDCPVLLGCLAAVAASGGAPRVLFVDGHEDAWPAARSTTGEAADMELGWMIGTTSADLPADLRRVIPVLQPDDAIVLGTRDEEELAEAGVGSAASMSSEWFGPTRIRRATQMRWLARLPAPSAVVGRGGCTSTSMSSRQTACERSTTRRPAVSTGPR